MLEEEYTEEDLQKRIEAYNARRRTLANHMIRALEQRDLGALKSEDVSLESAPSFWEGELEKANRGEI